MKLSAKIILIFLISINASLAQTNPTIETTRVADNLYKMFIYVSSRSSVNLFAFIGSDGVLLIDAGYTFSTDLIKTELKKITDKKIRYIINTHRDGDHTGGNKILGEEAVIISHQNYNSGLPGISVIDSLKMNFNGENILINYLPGHTKTDLVVSFQNANTAFIGDLIFTDSFPLVHPYGDIYLYEKALLSLSKMFDENTKILAGHGRDLMNSDIIVYKKMFNDTKNIVLKEIKKGKMPDEVKQAKVLRDWENWNSKLFPEMNADAWIDNLYTALKEGSKLSAYNYLKNTYDKNGVDEMLSAYRKIQSPKGKKHYFTENDFNNWGYALLGEQKINDAIEVFKINTEMFPSSANSFDSLGEAYMNAGNKELAIKYYEKSLELNPQNTNATEQLKKMQGGLK